MTNACVAVAQMTSTADIEANLRTCAELAKQAKARGAAVLCLPENFAFMGGGDGDANKMMEPLEGPLFSRCRALAQTHALWMCFGGFQERADDARKHNTHVVVDDHGAMRSIYRKLHLFDVQLGGAATYQESASTAPGTQLVVADSPVGKLGLSVCYDVRFPEMYTALTKMGAQVHLVPAAFTLTTGKEHWEALLRARAIETQCYVAAAAQTGRHNETRDTFGHAMIVDPWGTVLAQCRDGTGIALAEVDLAFLASVRARIPVQKHRRPDVYG